MEGDIATVNGGITLASGTKVSDAVATVNGNVVLDNATVHGSVTLTNGDLEMINASVVGEDVVLKSGKGSAPPEIRIEGGSVVEGDIVVRGRKGVVVYLSDGGDVRGEIRGAEVVRD